MMTAPYDAWLASLKVGDDVALDLASFGSRKYEIHKIARVTPTLFVLNSPHMTRIRRTSGYVHATRDYRRICEATPEVRNAEEARNLSAWLARLPAGPANGWKNPPLNVMRALKVAYDAEVAP